MRQRNILLLAFTLTFLSSNHVLAATAKPKTAAVPKAAAPAVPAAGGVTTGAPVAPGGLAWPKPDVVPPDVPASWTTGKSFAGIPTAPRVGCTAKDTCAWTCDLCLAKDDLSFCPTKNDWAITFDDGPSPFTPKLLDYLKANNLRATFFVVGSRVIEYPDIMRRVYAEGHHIGVHTWSHPQLTSLTNNKIIAEIMWTEAAIKATIGITTRYMRPPFGDTDNRVRSIMRQLGYKTTLWGPDTNDWQLVEKNTKTTVATIAAAVKGWIANSTTATTGYISLEHDIYQQSVDVALSSVLPPLQKAKFALKHVADCLADSSPYVEGLGSTVMSGAVTPSTVSTPAAPVSAANSSNNTSPSTPSTSPSTLPAKTSSAVTTNSAAYFTSGIAIFLALAGGLTL